MLADLVVLLGMRGGLRLSCRMLVESPGEGTCQLCLAAFRPGISSTPGKQDGRYPDVQIIDIYIQSVLINAN